MSLSLGDAVFWAAVASCAVAQGAILRSVLASPGRKTADVVWAVLPAFALVAAFVFTWRRLHP